MRGLLTTLALCVLAGAAVAQTPLASPKIEWAHKPSGRELYDRYPVAALKKDIQGQVRLHCHANATGRLEGCVVERENPEGMGFGKAALGLSSTFQMKAGGAAASVEGIEVTIPITWSLNEVYLDNPLWETVPTIKDVADAYPAGPNGVGPDASVFVQCIALASGELTNCLTDSNFRGFDDAALRVIQKFKAKPFVDRVGNPPVPVKFKIVMAPATSDVWFNRQIKTVTWTQTPTVKMFERAYPAAAVSAGLASGRAALDCTVAVTGQLTACIVESETPPSMGFGPAAIAVAEQFAMNPWTETGLPTAGAHIHLPVKLEKQDHAKK